MRGTYSNVSIATLCGLFGKSRQAWYDMQDRKDERQMQEELIVSWVREIRCSLPKVGGIKLMVMLSDTFSTHNMSIGRDAFFSVLRKHNLLIHFKRRYAVTTQSYHRYKIWPDLIQRSHPEKAEQVWVSDITYLRTKTGFIYLFLITDAFSRKIVGYHLSQSLKAKGCLMALQKAIRGRIYPDRNLIHHSDRGIQYCCDAYVEQLQKNQINISMTQSGSPYDNAIAERVNGILKLEFGLYKIFDSYSAAIDPVCKAISAYNTIRPHFSCDLKTPQRAHGMESENTAMCFLIKTGKVEAV
ncbi:MAG: IS3 family transposase [Bacteroidetes bacterium]|nr:IS3 family transposase [Bacteroidota bacterium]MBU1485384.1 IS3 family transposase [Bacteroidota bacterium]MBU1759843.1 IS3 family transposase [Bacteroidota bacterium]MBU2046013.1 IS3 family transposase [Bacteroidota bacterium]